MARNRNELTSTQRNEAYFKPLRKKIFKIGGRKLASYGLISHETIYRYCRKLAIAEGSEAKIFDSIKLHEKALKDAAEKDSKTVKELLNEDEVLENLISVSL